MAKRRRGWGLGGRLAYGAGTGLQQFFMQMMRDQAQQKSAERVATRQEEHDLRMAGRMEKSAAAAQQAALRKSAIDDLPKIVSGEMLPDAYLAKLEASGIDLFPSEFDDDYQGTGEVQAERSANRDRARAMVEGLRPSPRRRYEETAGKGIREATSPEQLDPNAIVSQLMAADDRTMPADDVPGMRVGGMLPEAYEYVAQAEDKAQALRTKPSERVTITDPQGATREQMFSPTQLAEGVTTSPTSAEQGALAGEEERALLGTVGGARAAQAGREAGARESATIDAKFKNLDKIIDMKTREATAQLGVVANEALAREGAQGIARAREAARTALPIVTQLQQKWFEAEPAIRTMWASGGGRAVLEAAEVAIQSGQPLKGAIPPAVKAYLELADYARPGLARASGQTGNPALMEQQWAKYLPTLSEALTPDTAVDKLARLEALSTAGIDLAVRASQGLAMTGAAVDEAMQPHMVRIFEELQRIRAGYQSKVPVGARPQSNAQPGAVPGTGTGQTIEFNLTPRGLQLVRPGGGR